MRRILHLAKTVLLVFVLISCSVYIVYSEEEDDEHKHLLFLYEITDFHGGLNTKTSLFSLKENQGDICQNLRFHDELGSLTKRTNLNLYGTADATNPILGMHRFYMKDGTKMLLVNADSDIYKGTDSSGAFTSILTVTTGNYRWQWTTWHDIAIGCDGYNQPVKYDGTSDSATYLGSCLATDAESGAGPDGTYTYKISFYTASYEVIFDTPSNTVTVSDNDITLTMIPIAPDTYGGEDVVGRKVYRTTNGGSLYALLSNGTIADNTTVTLTDSDADGALGAAYPAGDATYKPPKGKFVLIHDGRLWFANRPSTYPSRVWYSDTESHDVFLDDAYWDVRQNDGDEVTLFSQVLGQLTIGKNNSISRLFTDGKTTDWSLSDPFTFIGCQAPYSVANYARGLIYLARDGLYTFNGQYPKLISDVVTPEIGDISSSDFVNCWGMYHRNTYYLAYSSDTSSVAYNNRILVYDILSDAYSIDLLNINCFTAFNSGDDWGILYAGGSDAGKVYSYEISDNQILHRRYSDFTGLWDDMRYIPESIGGDPDDPVLEIARTETIDELTGTIDNMVGVIDREDEKGNYVSQVLSIDAVSFDKLYWNETIPVAGGDVTIKLRTSGTGEENLLLNDCFEFWGNYADKVQPNDWTAESTSTSVIACSSETTTVYRGTYAAKVETEATISQILLNSSDYAGKSLAFSAWLKSANTINEKVYIEIDDGYSTDRAYYENGGAWKETEATLTLNATATSVTLKCAVIGGADACAYFDQVMVIEGTTASNDWTAWSSAFTNPAGDDISGETVNSYLQYLIEMSTDDKTYTPNLISQNNYVVKLTYNKEGSEASDNIPFKWRSGWIKLKAPGYDKVLKKLYLYHEGTTGTLTITVDTLDGEQDTFEIDLNENKEYYEARFTSGALRGKWFRITLENNDNNPLTIKRLGIVYDIEPKLL